MKSYELVVVYKADMGDAGLRAEAKRTKEALTANGATEIVIENWGKREFSYPMKGENYGYYLNFTFKADNSKLITELERLMSINDTVLRYQTYRSDLRFKKFKAPSRRSTQTDSDSDDFFSSASIN